MILCSYLNNINSAKTVRMILYRVIRFESQIKIAHGHGHGTEQCVALDLAMFEEVQGVPADHLINVCEDDEVVFTKFFRGVQPIFYKLDSVFLLTIFIEPRDHTVRKDFANKYFNVLPHIVVHLSVWGSNQRDMHNFTSVYKIKSFCFFDNVPHQWLGLLN